MGWLFAAGLIAVFLMLPLAWAAALSGALTIGAIAAGVYMNRA